MKIEKWKDMGYVVFYVNNNGKALILSSGEDLKEQELKELASSRLKEFLLNK